MKILIFRTSWEQYDNEGCFDILYSPWRINKEDAISDHQKILEFVKVSRNVSVNNIECDTILCSKEDIEKLLKEEK